MFPAAPVAIHGCAVNTRRGTLSLLLVAVATFATVAAKQRRTTSALVGGALLSHSFPLSASIARASHSFAIARSAPAHSFRTASAAH